MGRFIVKLFLTFITNFFLVILFTFFLIRVLPGNPIDGELPLKPEVQSKMIEYYKLNESLIYQLVYYIRDILNFNLGSSIYFQGQSVYDLLYNYGKATFILSFIASIVFILIGFFLGTISAMKYESKVDRSILFFSNLFLSLPSLLWGPLLIYFFSIKMNLLPPALLDGPSYYILPIATLSLKPASTLILVLRSKLLEIKKENYIITAKAKGLSTIKVYFIHAIKNSIPFVLSFLSLQLVSLFSGSLVVESLFSISGLGKLFVLSVNERDYPLIMGMIILVTFIILLFDYVSKVLSLYVDPRLKTK